MLLPTELREYIARNIEDKRTLLHLALTCQAFKEVALDALWESIYNLSPLIKTASRKGDLWDLKPNPEHERDRSGIPEHILIFVREIEEKDWTKLRYYSTRIKHLDSVPWFDSVDPMVLNELTSFRPGKLLFPKLESLCLIMERAELTKDRRHLVPLIGRSVSVLEIELYAEGIDASQLRCFFQDWTEACPNVQQATIRFDLYSGEDDIDALELTISLWQKLETFDVEGIVVTEKLIHELQKLPHLRKCKLHPSSSYPEKQDSPGQGWTPSLPRGQFPVLNVFEIINEPNWWFLSTVLESIGSQIKECFVKDYDYWKLPIPICTTFFQTLSQYSNLHTLHISTLSNIMTQDDDVNSGTKILSPLFNLQRLKTVYLFTTILITADDQFLLGISQAWKDLESLSLAAPVPSSGISRDRSPEPAMQMTFLGLFPVLETCIKLQVLEIACVCTPLVATNFCALLPSSVQLDKLIFFRATLLGDPVAFATQIRELLPTTNVTLKYPYAMSRNEEQREVWIKFHETMKEYE